jgi:tRNA threonylcarbamoyladenosine biosynthesis protein TsaB
VGLERMTDDLAVAPGALAQQLPPGTLMVGDAAEAYPEAFGRGLVCLPFATHHPRGGVLARLGDRLLAAGRGSELGALEPVYVRPSEAELARMPAAGRAR